MRSSAAARALWYAGWPARQTLILPIRLYRWTLAGVFGGNCRFYPSCSGYAMLAIERSGAVRGVAFAVWRVLRCSPLSDGGVDHPPIGRTWRALHPGHPEDVDAPAGAAVRLDRVGAVRS
jgi:putative membrane protein insertion efficiency factor